MKKWGFLFLAGLLAACGQQQTPVDRQPSAKRSDSVGSTETPWWAALGLPEPDTVVIPSEEAADVKASILTTGFFHGDEVEDDAAARQWWGLFLARDGSFYLNKTAIKQKHVYDAVLDEDENQAGSGWEISTPGPDSCLLLFSGIRGLSAGRLDAAQGVHPQYLYPGEQWPFKLSGKSYSLKGEGAVKTIGEEEKVVVNFRLWLETTDNGQVRRQLLVARPSFDDAMIELLWVGDIDRDGRPDFVFNLSDHYNLTYIGLFLSSGAANEELVRFVGGIASAGC